MSTPSDEAQAPPPAQATTQAPADAPPAAAPPAAQPSDDFLVKPPPGRPKHRGKVVRYDGCSMRDWNQMLSMRQGNAKPVPTASLPRLSQAEIRKHDQPGDVWMVVHGVVYDCSSWARFHPGGDATIMEAAGRDGTALFDLYHRWVAVDVMLAPFIKGIYDPRL